MINRRIVLLLAAALLSLDAIPQMSKGDKFYENSDYFRAIPYYKKEARSRQPERKQAALIKLASSYRHINDYVHAEESYARAIETGAKGDLDPQVYYDYAQVLKINTKYEEAAVQLSEYLKLVPNDEKAKSALKFTQEIKYYLSKPVEYQIRNIGSVNTPKAEFSPYIAGGKLMFVAERESFDFINYEVNNFNGEPFLNMYISNLAGFEVKKSKQLSSKLNSEFHEGPGCVSGDGQTLYFTRSGPSKKKGAPGISRIFSATGSTKNWKNFTELPFNSDDYSVAHPSISSDNNTIFFTSNMPGGMGGKDIWMAVREGETWGKPINLGPDVNTTGDEMFPSVRKDGVLFFSSNGLPGFGGLDIYSAKMVDGKWLLQKNEGLNLNSSTDDFGITFLNDSMGYFSSNRPGGKGGDDIYLYEYHSKVAQVDGTVLLTENLKDYAQGKKVVLLDDKGVAIDSTRTDDKGYFVFRNLDPDKKYMAVIEEDDPQLVNKARFYMAVNDSTIQRVTTKEGGRRFAFKNLPVDPNGLPDLYTQDDMVFAGTLVSDGNKPLKNARLKIVNEYGDVVEETTTNENGAFAFRNIPADQNYIVSIEEGDSHLSEGARIALLNKSGKEVRSFIKEKGKFNFRVMSADKNMLEDLDAEDVNLVMGIYGYMYDQDKKPIANAKIRVRNEDGSNLQEITTTDKGRFNFKGLDAEKNYLFETDESDPSLAGVKRIYISDSKGRIYKVIEMEGGKFTFRILDVDKSALGEFVLDDPALRSTVGLSGYVYDQDKKPIANAKIRVKNEDGSNPQEAITSDKGRFTFRGLDPEKNYLFETDENDPNLTNVKKMYISDRKGNIYKVIEMEGGRFTFKILDVDKAALGEFKLDDPALRASKKKEKEKEIAKEKPKDKPKEEEEEESEISITIVENIYYAYGDYKIGPDGEVVLNKAVDALNEYPKLIMEISSHTDSQSSSAFNLGLSNRRAQAAVEYLVAHGISRSRLKARGYGETKLLNHCAEGVTCSDEEHKVNRRTEFKITKPIKKAK